MGIENISTFDFLSKPDEKSIEAALKELTFLGAVRKASEKSNLVELTDDGRKMACFPLDPKLILVTKNDNIRRKYSSRFQTFSLFVGRGRIRLSRRNVETSQFNECRNDLLIVVESQRKTKNATRKIHDERRRSFNVFERFQNVFGE